MHCFQPFNIEDVDLNPFKMIGKDWALVTSGTKKECNTMTVSWGGMGVIWNKNVVFIFVRDSRYTKEFIDDGEFFTLSFLEDGMKESLNICGSKSGRDIDKFKEAGLTPAYKLGIPFPDESNFVILCKKMAAIPMTADTFTDMDIDKKFYADGDYHTMYVGEIIESMAR